MKHFTESGRVKSSRATHFLAASRTAHSRTASSRFLALAGAVALAGAGSGVARAQVGGSFDNYFVSRGRPVRLAPSGNWVGVKVKPNTSSKLLRGLSSEGALDKDRKARRFSSRNIVLVPVEAGASAAQKNALRARLAGSSVVAGAARAYIFNGRADKPLIDVGEAVVRFASGDSQNAARIVAPLGGEIVRKVGAYSPNTFLVRASRDGSGVRLANKLATRSDVVFSEPNMIVPKIPFGTTNDPLYPNQWHLKNTGQGGGKATADVNIERAWDITRGTQDITIAIMDTGTDAAHEDLAPNMVPGYDFIDQDADPSPSGPNDNHGTACAGVAAGIGNNGIGVSGAAQNCKIMPIRIIGSEEGEGATDVETADSFDFAVRQGADVLSNSWGYEQGYPEPTVIAAAIQRAVKVGRGGKGCVILFASGNGDRDGVGDSIDGFGPGTAELAADSNVIAVGATNNFDRVTTYSNFGESLDIVAPSGPGRFDGGTLGITTTDRTGAPGYTATNYDSTFDGTSSACPLVAGVAALILSAEPELTYSQVRERLQESADKVDFAGGTYDSAGHSRIYGFGRLNAYRALLGRAPKVTVVTPPDGAALKGIVPVTARTANDALVSRMVFDQRRVFSLVNNPTVNKAIPDYFVEGVTDTLTVGPNLPTRFVQSTANVRVRVEHSYVGDLEIALIYNDVRGRQVREVIYDHANGGDRVLDLNVPLPAALRPVAGASYTLQVLDDVQEDTGTFVSWGLTLGTAYTPIGTQEATSHTVETDWGVRWDTSKVITGTYEVRATAIATDGATYSDSNGGLSVTGISENSFVLSGRVVDARGVGVAGVTVTNVTTNRAVRTNASGDFSFTGLPSGQFVLTSSISGGFFAQPTQNVTISSASITNLRFTLLQRDLVAPALTVTNPPDGSSLRTLSQVRGTATDVGGVGISRVTGVLYRRPRPGTSAVPGYYTKAGTFAPRQSEETERVAAGTTRFALVVPTDEGVYSLTLRAYDRAGNIQTKTVTYTIDRTLPVVVILTPKNLGLLTNSVVTAAGTALDTGGSGVARVTVRLFRAARGTLRAGYYNPTTRTYTPTSTAANDLVATLTAGRWTIRLPRLEATRYSLRATATDKAGNQGIANTIFTVNVPSVPSA